MFMILNMFVIPLLLRNRLRRLRRLCRRRFQRRRLLLHHILQRGEDRKNGDPGSEDHRSEKVGGCPDGLAIPNLAAKRAGDARSSWKKPLKPRAADSLRQHGYGVS